MNIYSSITKFLGSLSYFMRGNLSYLAGFIIGAISYYIKEFWGLERDFLEKFVRFVQSFAAGIFVTYLHTKR